MNRRPLRRSLAATLLFAAFTAALPAAPAPYSPDANTVMLFHFDEAAGGAAANAVAGKNKAYTWTFSSSTGSANSALLGAAGFTGFGKCMDLGSTATNLGAAYDGNGNSAYDGESVDSVALSTLGIGGTAPFTLEALVSPNALNAVNRELICTDSGAATRGFQFRMTSGGLLEFNMIGVGGAQKFATIPTSGTHAIAVGQWFHVAFVYDGANCRFYWTRLDSGATAANQLGSPQTLGLTGAGSITGPLVIGNENRAAGGEGAQCKIDEVRLSNIARPASGFLFANPDDTDGDGLDDSWEITHFGDTVSQNGDGDPDNDLASNAQEFAAGTDPLSAASFPDTDADGLVDPWEITHFSTLAAQASGGDPDGDGATNAEEYAARSNPADIWSIPTDTDGDGLPDAWETARFGTLSHSGYDDNDTDGYTNHAEQLADTDPLSAAAKPLWTPPTATLVRDSTLSANARLFANGATYGRAINGIAYQSQILLSYDGYQYTAWYDNTALTVFIARRTINGEVPGAWETVNTGSSFVNGVNGDAHNVITLGICPADGTLHLAWDHHGHTLRYRRSVAGLCTTNKAAWGAEMLNAEQNWLVSAGQPVPIVTYPLFITAPDGKLVFQWRYGGSGDGDNFLSVYNGSTGAWSAPVQFDTRVGTYVESATSNSRNAYLNGVDFGADGSMHITWTYREGAGTSNHDICYAYSTDLGVTWRNNVGTVIADTSLGQRIGLTSPGILVKRKDMRQLMINQQTQCVTPDGRVHMMMLHRREDPGFEYPNLTTANFSIIGTAYYHYYRDPLSNTWTQRRIPPDIAPVGSRPCLGYDAQGNLYAVFLTYTDRSQVFPGYRGGYLAVATASKLSSYTDWKVSYVSTTKYNGEPQLDQARLEQENLLSIFVQEDSAVTTAVGTPLHVIEFSVAPAVIPDADSDDLPDAWEQSHFGGTAGQGGSDDSDGDGQTNLQEYVAGTVPTNPSDQFAVGGIQPTAPGTGLEVSLPGKAGRIYLLDRSTTLESDGWTQIDAQGPLADDAVVSFVDAEPPAPRAFYRVRVQLP